MNRITKDRWNLAQKHEIEIWERTSKNSLNIMEELIEAGELQKFVISKIPKFSSHNKKILEIGVGPLGIGWVGLFGMGDQNIGIEPLPILIPKVEMSELNNFVESLQKRVKILNIKGEDIPFRSNSFDIVVCNNVLDHVQDYISVLKEVYRVMKKGGLFLFSVNVFSIAGYIKWNYYQRKFYFDSPNVLCHPHSFKFSDIKSILVKQSFKIVHSNKENYTLFSRVIGKAKIARFICTN